MTTKKATKNTSPRLTPQAAGADCLTSATTATLITGDQRQQILREHLLLISSENGIAEPGFLEPWPDNRADEIRGHRYTWCSSQLNTDFALAAQMELEEDIWHDDGGDGMFDFFYSPMYWNLREAFVVQALKGSDDAFLLAIWRAYTAGRVSPSRLTPSTPEERKARNLEEHLQGVRSRALGQANTLEREERKKDERTVRALAMLEASEVKAEQ